jgi:hypothetical protein
MMTEPSIVVRIVADHDLRSPDPWDTARGIAEATHRQIRFGEYLLGEDGSIVQGPFRCQGYIITVEDLHMVLKYQSQFLALLNAARPVADWLGHIQDTKQQVGNLNAELVYELRSAVDALAELVQTEGGYDEGLSLE